MTTPRTVIGVDLGGTKIEVVVARVGVDADGHVAEVVARVRTPTPQGYDAITGRLASFVREVADGAGVALDEVPIAVGMPGSITRAGLVKNSNTTCLNGRPFRDDVSRALDKAIAFENDANLFALAETKLGAARSFADGVVFGVIMGTGVGGGIVVRGAPWSGPMGVAGEWGHHAVWAGSPDARPCYCGNRGCVEAHLAGPAIEAQYRARAGQDRTVADIVARRRDDVHAAAIVDAALDTFARGLANVIDILDPSAIVLGGGLSKLSIFYDEGRERVARLAFTDDLTTPILQHACGDSAGVLGAALLAASAD